MRKLFLCSLAILLGGFLLPGCMYTDTVPSTYDQGDLLCDSDCGGDQAGASLQSVVTGTTAGNGARGTFFPKEPGEYWMNQQPVESGETAECARYASAGGGGPIRIDTFRNEAAHASFDGCPNNTLCGWQGATLAGDPTGWEFSVCEQPFPITPNPINLCNTGNGLCTGYLGSPHFVGGPFFAIAADSYASELAYVNLDTDTSGAATFFQNEVRNPGSLCDDCSALAAVPSDPLPAGKVYICHVPPGNPDNAHTIAISDSAVDAHVAHGDNPDSVGSGCGAAAAGDGNIVDPLPDEQPPAQLATGLLADLGLQTMAGALPWGDDFSGSPWVDERALAELYDVLSTVPTNAEGFSQLNITRLNGPAEDIVLGAPVAVHVKLDPLAGQYQFALDTSSPSLSEMVNWILDNTEDGKAVQLNSLSFGLDNGATIKGATLRRVYPFEIALGHQRLGMFLDQLEAGTLARTDDQLDRRISNQR